jgi:hypothetical protein
VSGFWDWALTNDILPTSLAKYPFKVTTHSLTLVICCLLSCDACVFMHLRDNINPVVHILSTAHLNPIRGSIHCIEMEGKQEEQRWLHFSQAWGVD